MNIVAILGRQPELSLAELEQRFGSAHVQPFSEYAATVESDAFDITALGGVIKAGEVVAELEKADWQRLSRDIVQRYARTLKGDGKLTLGISVYGFDVPPREVQRTGLALKQSLKKQGRSVRLVPNDNSALSTATSHHNKLGLSDNKVELMIVYGPHTVIVARSVGAQNITALAARDQGRPKRDAFVGMLPPKLALMMINLSGLPAKSGLIDVSTGPSSGTQPESASSRRVVRPDEISGQTDDLKSNGQTILDPFCGTGVVLQEAALLGFDVYGTDLAEKMVDYSKANMEWLAVKYPVGSVRIEAGDAIEHQWQQPIGAVVAETYLGQPFSAPPAPDKLDKVRRIVDHITEQFLENIAAQIISGTPLCLAVPAWRDSNGRFTHLSVMNKLDSLGYEWQTLQHVDAKGLMYFREDQIVARQLLILKRK
jgi:tRNA G10  N-methylase Trm11